MSVASSAQNAGKQSTCAAQVKAQTLPGVGRMAKRQAAGSWNTSRGQLIQQTPQARPRMMRIKHTARPHCGTELNPDLIDLISKRRKGTFFHCKECNEKITTSDEFNIILLVGNILVGWGVFLFTKKILTILFLANPLVKATALFAAFLSALAFDIIYNYLVFRFLFNKRNDRC